MTLGGHINIPRLIGLVLVGGYFLWCVLHPADWHFIDSVNLTIHEAGHPLLSVFGEFLGILGGSLSQMLIPFLFAGYFFLRQEHFSGAIVLMWLAQSLSNVSVYAGDAVNMELPLLGGDGVIHDWNYLLSALDLLSHTSLIAHTIYTVSIGIFVVATVLAVRSLLAKPSFGVE